MVNMYERASGDSEVRDSERGVTRVFGKSRSTGEKRAIFQHRAEAAPVEVEHAVVEAMSAENGQAPQVEDAFAEAEAKPQTAQPETDQPAYTEAASQLDKVDHEPVADDSEAWSEAPADETFPPEAWVPVKVEHPLAQKVREFAEMTRMNESPSADALADSMETEPFVLLDRDPGPEIAALLKEKSREFAFLGYEHITANEIWSYFQHQQKRRPRSLHELVGEILSLQPQAIMNYGLQAAAYQGATQSIEDLLGEMN